MKKNSAIHIATLADFVVWCANGHEEGVEIAPFLREALWRFVEHCATEAGRMMNFIGCSRSRTKAGHASLMTSTLRTSTF